VLAVDFQTAREAGLQGLGDEAVLEQAAREGRILVSHDRRTMPIHFANFTATKTSAGVILISQNLLIIQVVEDLGLIWEASFESRCLPRSLGLSNPYRRPGWPSSGLWGSWMLTSPASPTGTIAFLDLYALLDYRLERPSFIQCSTDVTVPAARGS
jgi:hypothetical protein